MIPYFEQPSLKVGPLTVHAFGALVALAVVAGYLLAVRRARAKGLDAAVMESLLAWVLGVGFICAHLFAVLVYFPKELRAHPWMILRFWENLSS
ncbi:MAG: prolipoprotein diacylglyceryl transferase family protein, partial [Acidobacteriota bacterium]